MSILCATDFSLCARTAAELGAALARRLGERLRLVHVIEPAFMPAPEAAGAGTLAVEQAVEARLASWCRDLERQGITVESEVRTGTAAAAVLAAARTEPCRLLVVGTHGRQGPARLLLGSVAADVVRGAEIPVLVARAGAADPARWAT